MSYVLEPEVAGGWGEGTIADTSSHPPRISKLVYEFEGWSGDDLLTTFPCFIVTNRLADRIQTESLSGYQLVPVEVTKSDIFLELYSNIKLPKFYWLQVTGEPGVNDFAILHDYRLTVSERAFNLISSFKMDNCLVEKL